MTPKGLLHYVTYHSYPPPPISLCNVSKRKASREIDKARQHFFFLKGLYLYTEKPL